MTAVVCKGSLGRLWCALDKLDVEARKALRFDVPGRAAAAAVAAAREPRGVDAGELDRLLSAQRHSAERDKADALAGLKALYAAEVAVRDSAARELREQRDSVMASVRQRDAALQVRAHRDCVIIRGFPAPVTCTHPPQALSAEGAPHHLACVDVLLPLSTWCGCVAPHAIFLESTWKKGHVACQRCCGEK